MRPALLALAALLIAAPAIADEYTGDYTGGGINDPLIPPDAFAGDHAGMHLVCIPTRAHLGRHPPGRRWPRSGRMMAFHPTIRHHPHAKRFCPRAHQRCHWEEDLGGPPGAEPGWTFAEGFEGAADDVGAGMAGGESGAFPADAGGNGAAIEAALISPDAFAAAYEVAKIGLFSLPGGGGSGGGPGGPWPPSPPAVGEPPIWLMLLFGALAVALFKRTRS